MTIVRICRSKAVLRHLRGPDLGEVGLIVSTYDSNDSYALRARHGLVPTSFRLCLLSSVWGGEQATRKLLSPGSFHPSTLGLTRVESQLCATDGDDALAEGSARTDSELVFL